MFLRVSAAVFLFNFHHNNILLVFSDFFVSVKKVHNYNSRFASKLSYYISSVCTNYGKLV